VAFGLHVLCSCVYVKAVCILVSGVVKVVRLQRVGTGEREWHFEGF